MDRKALSKSAPSMGRRSSKDVAKKQTTIKDINTWIDKGTKGDANMKGSRNVGMLTENVTEQRLLYTRQMELGRERYKFLTSHSYEKQKFVESQNRKTRSMKRMMQNARRIIETSHSKPETPRRSITVRIPQMEETTKDASGAEPPGDTERKEPAPKTEPKSAPILAKATEEKEKPHPKSTDEKKTVHFPKPIRSGKKPVISGRAMYIDLSSSVEARRTPDSVRKTPEPRRTPDLARKTPDITRRTPDIARKTPDITRKSNDTHNSNEKLPSLQNPKPKAKKVSYPSRTNSGVSRKSGRNSSLEKTKSENVPLNRSTDAPTHTDAPDGLLHWRLRSKRNMPQFGHKFSSSVGDPRYVALTNTLVPCDDLGKPIVSVEDIIAKKEILRGESRCEQKSRAKQLHARFIAYLLEQELRK